MALQEYRKGSMTVMFKVIQGKPHPTFSIGRSGQKLVDLGIAFRSVDGPIGYLPFYGAKDFDLNGDTSRKEAFLARLPIDLSSVASPHTLLLKEAAGDVEFLGSGSEALMDIQMAVKNDLRRHAMSCASGVLIDGVMVALGGPAIKSLVEHMVKAKVKQFMLSKAMSGAVKTYLKDQASLDADMFLRLAP
jgi:hypothetical protein